MGTLIVRLALSVDKDGSLLLMRPVRCVCAGFGKELLEVFIEVGKVLDEFRYRFVEAELVISQAL